MKTELIRNILQTYGKHGWQLSRVLLSEATKQKLTDLAEIFGDAAIESSEIDAVWVSRPSANNREAWELRLLSENPFALFETFPGDISSQERDNKLREMENRLSEKLKTTKEKAPAPKSENQKRRKK